VLLAGTASVGYELVRVSPRIAEAITLGKTSSATRAPARMAFQDTNAGP